MSAVRAGVLLAMLLATGVMAETSTRAIGTGNLDALPYGVAGWRGVDAVASVDEETLRLLGADRYIFRTYRREQVPVDLYIAYYAEQKPGVSIHSPLHCLPGNGWEPVNIGTVALTGNGNSGPVARRMVVRRRQDQAIVLYWYAVHGRIVAGEIASRAWLLIDALRLHRTDAALVRIASPIERSEDAAQRRAVAFADELLPSISTLWN